VSLVASVSLTSEGYQLVINNNNLLNTHFLDVDPAFSFPALLSLSHHRSDVAAINPSHGPCKHNIGSPGGPPNFELAWLASLPFGRRVFNCPSEQ